MENIFRCGQQLCFLLSAAVASFDLLSHIKNIKPYSCRNGIVQPAGLHYPAVKMFKICFSFSSWQRAVSVNCTVLSF
jgi:hypothetical protein